MQVNNNNYRGYFGSIFMIFCNYSSKELDNLVSAKNEGY